MYTSDVNELMLCLCFLCIVSVFSEEDRGSEPNAPKRGKEVIIIDQNVFEDTSVLSRILAQ